MVLASSLGKVKGSHSEAITERRIWRISVRVLTTVFRMGLPLYSSVSVLSISTAHHGIATRVCNFSRALVDFYHAPTCLFEARGLPAPALWERWVGITHDAILLDHNACSQQRCCQAPGPRLLFSPAAHTGFKGNFKILWKQQGNQHVWMLGLIWAVPFVRFFFHVSSTNRAKEEATLTFGSVTHEEFKKLT